ncbi:MAG TPA: hypothetical protein IGS52_10740 [Oscillatoriaceae cyanobacterium M33_DOE_052]|nr:hypothetical protein [Oscillatoriaceae cyanobacterium M33_DOE_052]
MTINGAGAIGGACTSLGPDRPATAPVMVRRWGDGSACQTRQGFSLAAPAP